MGIIKNFNRLPLENILLYSHLKLIAIFEYPIIKKRNQSDVKLYLANGHIRQ
jgi:hypothetical protein